MSRKLTISGSTGRPFVMIKRKISRKVSMTTRIFCRSGSYEGVTLEKSFAVPIRESKELSCLLISGIRYEIMRAL